MKKCIKYLFSIIIIAIGTYFLANVSNVLGIGLTQHYTADRGPYTGELYFDSLVWSSAMFCNEHGGPYFNKADQQIIVTGTVGGRGVSADVTNGGTFTLRSGSHPNCFPGTASLQLIAVSYSGISNGGISAECGATSVAVAGTLYGTGIIHYSEGGGISASNDEVAYLLAEANANTPGVVPKSSYPNIAWWNRTEAAIAANRGKHTVFDEDPSLSQDQETEAKNAIIDKNQTQINKLNAEKEKLENKIARWNKIINKLNNKIGGYEDNISSLRSETSQNDELIAKKQN